MATCKSCGAAVTWKKENGRWYCFNHGTTTDHWDSCSSRRWKQTVSTGTRFENRVNSKGQLESGYADSIHGTKLDHIECLEAVGKDYHPDMCDCGIPPWEECKTTCKTRR